FFFFSSRRRHTRWPRDWSSDVCSSDLLAEAVLRAVLLESLGGIDHEDALASGGVFLVEHDDAGRDARAVKEIGGQADDGLEVAEIGRASCRGRVESSGGGVRVKVRRRR